jgi:hypothetical protein
VCRHVCAHLRLKPQNTALSPVPACIQTAKLPLPRIPISHSTLFRPSLPRSYPPSPIPSLARSSIAATTTASVFLQASLSKMPRSNLSLPRHQAPRHFRSRLTTTRIRRQIGVLPVAGDASRPGNRGPEPVKISAARVDRLWWSLGLQHEGGSGIVFPQAWTGLQSFFLARSRLRTTLEGICNSSRRPQRWP